MGVRSGDRYEVTDDERARFERDGYVHLPAVMREDELAELDAVYDAFMRGDSPSRAAISRTWSRASSAPTPRPTPSST